MAAGLVRLSGVSPDPLPNVNLATVVAESIDRGDVSADTLSNCPDVIAVTPLYLDRDANVLLTPGADVAPGQVGLDDDRDGVIDNASEMGAVGSDDQCVAPWSDDYPAALANPDSIVISKGAFVKDAPADDNGQAGDQRFLVQTENDDVSWTWTVIPR